MTPATSWPSRSSASETAKSGMPWRKLVVPSSGSTIQRLALVGAVDRAALLGEEASSRAAPCCSSAISVSSARRSAARDEIARPLQRDLQVLDLAEIAGEAAAGLEDRLDHDVEEGGAGHVSWRFGARSGAGASPTTLRPTVQARGQSAGQRCAAATAVWRWSSVRLGDELVEVVVVLAGALGEQVPLGGGERVGRRCRGRWRAGGRGGSGRSGCRRRRRARTSAAAAVSFGVDADAVEQADGVFDLAGMLPRRAASANQRVAACLVLRRRRGLRRRAGRGRTGRRGCRPRRPAGRARRRGGSRAGGPCLRDRGGRDCRSPRSCRPRRPSRNSRRPWRGRRRRRGLRDTSCRGRTAPRGRRRRRRTGTRTRPAPESRGTP